MPQKFFSGYPEGRRASRGGPPQSSLTGYTDLSPRHATQSTPDHSFSNASGGSGSAASSAIYGSPSPAYRQRRVESQGIEASGHYSVGSPAWRQSSSRSGHRQRPVESPKDYELSRPSTQANRLKQLGDGSPPSWWGDQSSTSSNTKSRSRGDREHYQSLEPQQQHPPPQTDSVYEPSWPATSPPRHIGRGSPHGRDSTPDRSQQQSQQVFELEAQLERVRAELKQTEDLLIHSDTERERERDTHAAEQRAALQLLRETQDALESERAARAEAEGALAKANELLRKKSESEQRQRQASGHGDALPTSRGKRNGKGETDGRDSTSAHEPRPPRERRVVMKEPSGDSDRRTPSSKSKTLDRLTRGTRQRSHHDRDNALGSRSEQDRSDDRAMEQHERRAMQALEAEMVGFGVDDEIINPASNDIFKERIPDESRGMAGRLVPCSLCGRQFVEDRLKKHTQACSKVQKKRRPMNPAAQRINGTEAEQFVRRGKPGGTRNARGKKPTQPQPKEKYDWRSKSEAFRSAMRAARGQA